MNDSRNPGSRIDGSWHPKIEAGGTTRRSRHTELLILCARIDFTP